MVAVFAVAICTLTVLVSRSFNDRIFQQLYTNSATVEGSFDFTIGIGNNNLRETNFINGTRALQVLDTFDNLKCAIRTASGVFIPKNPTVFLGYNDSNYIFDRSLYYLRFVAIDIKEEIKRGLINTSKVAPLPSKTLYSTKNLLSTLGLSTFPQGLVTRLNMGRFAEFRASYYNQSKVIVFPGFFSNYSYARTVPIIEESILMDSVSNGVPLHLYADSSTLLSLTVPYFANTRGEFPEFTKFIQSQSLTNYGSYIVCKLVDPMPFYDNYLIATTKGKIYAIGSKIIASLGTQSQAVFYPILHDYNRFTTDVQRILFISTIFSSGLTVLSLVVVYSVLKLVLHKHKSETAVLHVLGGSFLSEFSHLIFYTQLLAFLGVGLAYATSGLLFRLINATVAGASSDKQAVSFYAQQSISAWIVACSVGFCGPLLTAFLHAIYSYSSQVSLSTAIKKINDKLSDTSRSALRVLASPSVFSQAVLGGFSSVLGIVILLVCPQLIYEPSHPYTTFMFAVLLAFFIYGVAMLLANFSHLAELSLATLLLALERSWVRRLVKTKLKTDAESNRHAILVFSLTLAFVAIIFTNIQIYRNLYNFKFALSFANTDLVLISPFSSSKLVNYKRQMLTAKIPFTYSGVYQSLDRILSPSGIISISTHSTLSELSANQTISVITPNFAQQLQQGAVPPHYSTVLGNARDRDPIEVLYSRFGQSGTILSDFMAQQLNQDCSESTVSSASRLHLRLFNKDGAYATREVQCVASSSFFPGFNFTQNLDVERYDSFINIESLLHFLEDDEFNFGQYQITSWNTYQMVFVDVLSDNQIHLSKADFLLRSNLQNQGYIILENKNIMDKLIKSDKDFGRLYSGTLGFCIVLNLFLLSAVRYLSTASQTRVTGILRYLGALPSTLLRVSIYESLATVLVGTAFGLALCISVAWLVGKQSAILNGIPFLILLPTQLLYLIPVLSIICAVLASCLTQRTVLRQKICDLVK